MEKKMTVSSEIEELLTVDDVAAILRVRPRWVYEAAARGDLPRVKVGGYVRFRREAIEQWIADQQKGQP